jgi:ribosomal protein S18 acetylase RimI-like enzyme
MAVQPTVQIANSSYAAFISDLLYEFNNEALLPETLAERMDQARHLETVFLAELDGSWVGLLVLRIAPTLSGPEGWAEVTELYVRSSSRRKGVGRSLMEAAIEYSRRRGCAEIRLLVDPANQIGLCFYEALGFQRDSWEMRRSFKP